MPRIANPETILYRQNKAGGLAQLKGHKLGLWEQVPDRENMLVARCKNKECQATASVNTEFNGTYVGPIAFLAQCPYRGKP